MFGKLKEKAAAMGNGAIEQHITTIQSLVQQNLGPDAKSIVNDESKLRVVFGHVYTVLPAPVRMVVSQDTFVTFCIQNRSKVLPKNAA